MRGTPHAEGSSVLGISRNGRVDGGPKLGRGFGGLPGSHSIFCCEMDRIWAIPAGLGGAEGGFVAGDLGAKKWGNPTKRNTTTRSTGWMPGMYLVWGWQISPRGHPPPPGSGYMAPRKSQVGLFLGGPFRNRHAMLEKTCVLVEKGGFLNQNGSLAHRTKRHWHRLTYPVVVDPSDFKGEHFLFSWKVHAAACIFSKKIKNDRPSVTIKKTKTLEKTLGGKLRPAVEVRPTQSLGRTSTLGGWNLSESKYYARQSLHIFSQKTFQHHKTQFLEMDVFCARLKEMGKGNATW